MIAGAPAISVVVTNYNYGAFVQQAVDAALGQSHAPLEVIVVDDGSTDDSLQRLQAAYGTHPAVKILSGRNGGQLQAFRRGMAEVRGEVICFLDADDYWDPDYLAALAQLYGHRRDIDFVFSDMHLSGRVQGEIAFAQGPVDLGYTAIATWQEAVWYGAPTSGISCRTEMARRCLDLPASFDEIWRLAADNCLVFGASLLGGRKYYLPTGAVHYRVHREGNWWFNQASERQFHHRYRSRALINHYAARMGMDGLTLKLAKAEFKSRPGLNWRESRRYLRMIWRSGEPLHRRLDHCLGVLGGYLRGRLRARG